MAQEENTNTISLNASNWEKIHKQGKKSKEQTPTHPSTPKPTGNGVVVLESPDSYNSEDDKPVSNPEAQPQTPLFSFSAIMQKKQKEHAQHFEQTKEVSEVTKSLQTMHSPTETMRANIDTIREHTQDNHATLEQHNESIVTLQNDYSSLDNSVTTINTVISTLKNEKQNYNEHKVETQQRTRNNEKRNTKA